MTWVVETALVNAVLASGLALLALAASRWSRRPALVHALWVLVLIKLVTPAVWELPVPVALDRAANESGSALASGLRLFVREMPPEQPQTPTFSRVPAGRASVPEAAAPALDPDPVPSNDAVAEAIALSPVSATAPPSVPPAPRLSAGQIAWFAVLIVWLAGSLAWLWVNGVRMRRFQRCLREAQPVDDDLAARGRELAAQMGLKSCPRIVLLDAPVSPLLWGCGRRTSIVLPAELFEQLGESERDALLVHELAHFRRGDHWVRVLELLVLGLYWWHPVTWLARREIERTEEECCDAWVVGQFPDTPRSYAEALLATIDFISERCVVLPPAASGVADVPAIERRLRQIMGGRVQKSLSRTTRWLLVGLSAILPFQPVLSIRAEAALISARSVPRPPAVSDLLKGHEQPPAGDTPPEASTSQFMEQLSPEQRALLDAINRKPPSLYATAESPTGRYLITSETGRRVQLEDRVTGKRGNLSDKQLTVVAFLPDDDSESWFVTGDVYGQVRLWRAEDPPVPVSFFGPQRGEILSLDVSPVASRAGRMVVSGSAKGSLYFWRLTETGVSVARGYDDLGARVSAARFSTDGRFVAVAIGQLLSGSSEVRLYDAATQDLLWQSRVDRRVAALQFTDAGRLQMFGWDGQMEEWDLDRREAVAWGSVDSEAVQSASFSPNSSALAAVVIQPEPPAAYADLLGAPVEFTAPTVTR